jgi:hypothetical protein
MPRDWQPDGAWLTPQGVLRPPASYVAAGISPAVCLGDIAPPIVCSPGLAWVARRDLLERHRLYDMCVVGGGDNVMAASAYGCFDIPAAHQNFSTKRNDHYLAWAIPFHQAVKGRVGFIDGNLYHLWHGERENRRYAERHEGLTRFDFVPASDVAVAEGGAWRWNSAKPDLHDFIRDYFAGRREDG